MNETYTSSTSVPHYYGDTVRIIFLVAAVVMVAGLPAVTGYLNFSPFFSVGSILLLCLAAGFTNPKQLWSAAANTIIASVGFLVFETHAVAAYGEHGAADIFFLSNLFLGLMFLLAVYFSVKTLRGLLLK